MVDDRIARLVSRLHRNTKNNKISWSVTADDEIFEAAFPRYALRIHAGEGRFSNMYFINILNEHGVSVENFSDADLTDRFFGTAPEQGWDGLMREIYEMARRQALGADQAIDDILVELE
jgi:hypothetical protein